VVQCAYSINIEYLSGMPGAKTAVKISVVFKLFETILLGGILLALSVTLLLQGYGVLSQNGAKALT